MSTTPALVGEPFLERYTALTTSGTTGVPGIFVIDAHSMAVTNVLVLRMVRAWLRAHDVFRLLVCGSRHDADL